MRSEHRAPLVASIIVVLACIGVMTHAVRTDALGGFARHTPMGMIAGSMLLPKAQPVLAAEAPRPAVAAPSPAKATTKEAAPAAPAGSQGRSSKPAKHTSSKGHRPAAASGHAAIASAATPTSKPRPKPTPAPAAPASRPPVVPVEPEPSEPGRGHGRGHDHSHGQGRDGQGGDDEGRDDDGRDDEGRGHGWGHGHGWGDDEGDDATPSRPSPPTRGLTLVLVIKAAIDDGRVHYGWPIDDGVLGEDDDRSDPGYPSWR